mgnify:CR=1 FL=1
MGFIFEHGVLSPSGLSSMWFGMLIAIALSAAVKFRAPTMSKEVGFDVGRHVFGAFGSLEQVILALLGISLWFSAKGSVSWVLFATLGLSIALQTFWFRPALNRRAITRIQHQTLESNSAHIVYVFIEFAKLLQLFFLSWMT